MALFGSPSNDKRPVFLNLLQIHLPLTALVSILHRVSGIGMIFGLPIVLIMFYCVVAGPAEYQTMVFLCSFTLSKIILLLILTGTMYHILAGLRHTYDDFAGTHALVDARYTAWLLLFAWVAWIVACIWRLWF